MAIKCRECGLYHTAIPIKDKDGNVTDYKRRYVQFPFVVDKEDGTTEKRWVNLFKVNTFTVFFIIILVMMSYAYKHDNDAYKGNVEKIKEYYQAKMSLCTGSLVDSNIDLVPKNLTGIIS